MSLQQQQQQQGEKFDSLNPLARGLKKCGLRESHISAYGEVEAFGDVICPFSFVQSARLQITKK